MKEEEKSTHVRVKKSALDKLRQFTFKKEGHLKYALFKEASRAIEDYVDRHTPLDTQQQHLSEQSLRADVKKRLDRAETMVRNGMSEHDEVKGRFLREKLEEVIDCHDDRTLRRYLKELIFRKGVLDFKGRFQDIGTFANERYLICVGDSDE